MGIKTALINGRISARSIASYLRLRPFFREVLVNLDIFSMIRKQDADRIKSMGADPAGIHINGNAKYDLLGACADPAIEADIRRLLNLGGSQSVFVAGNTRHGEEEMILDVYEKILAEFPDILLIIVPRHIDRTPAIVSMVKKRGFNCQLRTDLGENKARRTEKVVIINTFGELFKVYSIATIVFSGASLVPLGGQNPLEPAIWGKVVFYGPSMEDFADAKELLEEAEAGVPVSSPGMLAEKLIWFLHHPKALNAYGKRAREAVLKNRGAAGRHAQIIKDLVAEK
jgi:3-deoxy-D-manno-octulosonic-acid transferase